MGSCIVLKKWKITWAHFEIQFLKVFEKHFQLHKKKQLITVRKVYMINIMSELRIKNRSERGLDSCEVT